MKQMHEQPTFGLLLCWLKNIYPSSRSLIICCPVWTNKAELHNIKLTVLTLLSSGSADESQNISTEESPNVTCNPMANSMNNRHIQRMA